MSTRSIIVVTNNKKINRIYKHSDGYPTHNLEVIAETLEKVKRKTIKQVTDTICDTAGGSTRVEYFSNNPRLNDASLGLQGDLEWIYIVDLSEKRIDVYGGGYADQTPMEFIKSGTVNPLTYVNQLRDECQGREYKSIYKSMNRLYKLGFQINS